MVVAETRSQALDAAEAVEVEYEELPFALDAEAALAPGAPPVWDEVPDNLLVETFFGDEEATDAGLRPRRSRRPLDFHIGRVTAVALEPRAALGESIAATGALHALCRHRRRGAAKARTRRRARASRPRTARRLRRCRRKFRLQEPALCRIWAGVVGRAKTRPAGQVYRDPHRGLPHRLLRGVIW